MSRLHDDIRRIENTDPYTLSLQDAEGYTRTLLSELNKIEAKLGRRRQDQEEGDNSSEDYTKWRRGMLHVKSKILAKYRTYKQYCKEQRSQEFIDCGDFDPDNVDSLLRAARELIHRLRSEGVVLDPPEFAVLVALDRYVNVAPT